MIRNLLSFLSIAIVSVLAGCSVLSPNEEPNPTSGNIKTGQTTDLGTKVLSPAGGDFVISKPGDSLNGLTIHVENGSYTNARTFHVSEAPITSHTFGENFTPISPLITISNGGGYADSVMTIRIPFKKLPSNYFAMAFLYDDQSGELEGLPLLQLDDTSAVVATRSFDHSSIRSAFAAPYGSKIHALEDDVEVNSKIIMSAVPTGKLDLENTSGFTPGVDDWEFFNYGSYLEPEGHCAGQTIGMMYYYRDHKNLGNLFRKYDNDGADRKTPKIQEDDVQAYKFCSVLQHDQSIASRFVNVIGYFLQSWTKSDLITYYCFSYSIMMSHKPQYVFLKSYDGGGAHAILVWKTSSHKLYVCDPNAPGSDDLTIQLLDGSNQFASYKSGPKSQKSDHRYSTIMYAGATSLLNWHSIKSRWDEFKAGKIDNGYFPNYSVRFLNDSSDFVPLNDGQKLHRRTTFSTLGTGFNSTFRIFDQNQEEIQTDNNGAANLKAGHQLLGFYVTDNSDNWVGFRWISVEVEGDTTRLWPLAVGNSWTYKVTAFDTDNVPRSTNQYTNRVTDSLIVGGEVWYKIVGGDQLNNNWLTNRYDGVYVSKNGGEPSGLMYRYPCAPGDTMQSFRQKDPAATIYFAVVDTGVSLPVPAGRFRSVEYQQQFRDGAGHLLNEQEAEDQLHWSNPVTYYFAPGIGPVQYGSTAITESGTHHQFIRADLIGYQLK